MMYTRGLTTILILFALGWCIVLLTHGVALKGGDTLEQRGGASHANLQQTMARARHFRYYDGPGRARGGNRQTGRRPVPDPNSGRVTSSDTPPAREQESVAITGAQNHIDTPTSAVTPTTMLTQDSTPAVTADPPRSISTETPASIDIDTPAHVHTTHLPSSGSGAEEEKQGPSGSTQADRDEDPIATSSQDTSAGSVSDTPDSPRETSSSSAGSHGTSSLRSWAWDRLPTREHPERPGRPADLNSDAWDEFMTIFKPTYECKKKKRYGSAQDTGWTLCVDVPLPRKNCIVYSLGINNQWSFDDAIAEDGCTVYAYDPTMNKGPHTRGERIHFSDTGIFGTSDFTLQGFPNARFDTVTHLMEVNGHDHIDILKMDIEASEWSTIDEMIKSGTLNKVTQLLIEWHFSPVGHGFPPKGWRATPEKALSWVRTIANVKAAGLEPYYRRGNPNCWTKKYYGESKSQQKRITQCQEMGYLRTSLIGNDGSTIDSSDNVYDEEEEQKEEEEEEGES